MPRIKAYMPKHMEDTIISRKCLFQAFIIFVEDVYCFWK